MQVLIHSPHLKAQNTQSGHFGPKTELSNINLLNINQQIISVATGRLDQNADRDILLVGTATNLMAYDVENNKDLFYKDVSS